MEFNTGEKTNQTDLSFLDVILPEKVQNSSHRTKKIKFCIADVKKAPRCGVKLQEYQRKKNTNSKTRHVSSHSHLQDIILGSFVLANSSETSAFLQRFFEILE